LEIDARVAKHAIIHTSTLAYFMSLLFTPFVWLLLILLVAVKREVKA
jgi:hypothetical protein